MTTKNYQEVNGKSGIIENIFMASKLESIDKLGAQCDF
jgi:hypothetical protein